MLSVLLYIFCVHTCLLSTLSDSISSTAKQSSIEKPGKKLKHLHVLFRHGDRSPIYSYAISAQAFEELWPAGRGELTDIGIEQEFLLGRWVRSKYSEFIPQTYNASEYHMRSTDIDRTLMSAQAFTEGFYEHAKSPLEQFNVTWRPIPVHTVKENRDILLGAADCPLLKKLQNLRMDSKKSLDFEREHLQLFKTMNEHMPGAHVDRKNIRQVHDTTVCMRAHNLSMLQWITPFLLDELDKVSQFYWIQSYASTDEIVRLEIGVFLDAMFEHMYAVAEGRPPGIGEDHHLSTQHVMGYSAHDTDVTCLLAAFGVYNDMAIEYSSAVVFELHEPEPPVSADNYLFRMLYKRGWRDEVGEYLLPKVCKGYKAEQGCPLGVLKQGMQSMLVAPHDYKAACSIDSVQLDYVVTGLSVLIVVLGIICIVLSVVVFRFNRRRGGFEFDRFEPEI